MASARKKPSPPPPDPERLARATELAERAPRPAAAGRIRFGTAGWTDRTLIESKLFYPKTSLSPEARLRYYAEHFEIVEVDATYYALLPPETAERWISWTPPSFRFDVKAFPVLTGHPIDVRRLPADLKAECQALGHATRAYPDKLPEPLNDALTERFLAFIEPLVEAERLGAVLLQFPPWFTANLENTRKLERLRERLPTLALSAEFRHGSWFDDRRRRTLDLLRGLQMSFVCIDQPLIASELLPVTNPALALVRFHGHNVGGWKKKGASVHERFDYLYDPSELHAWLEPIRKLEQEAERVHAVFNNCVRNYAVLNAKDLAALLEPEPEPEEQ
jgi:uncharacterized protein YecE (DUF72 family)